LREEFDLVLIDTPPVLGLADARIVARHVDHVVLAVRWSRTTWRAVQSALRVLTETGASVLGVVVTRADTNRLAAFEVPEAEPYRARHRSYYREYYLAGSEVLATPPSKVEGPRA
jgi:Mrp family chromosome partitioning ATPase